MAKDILDISPVVRNHRLVLENPPSGFDVHSRRILSDGEEAVNNIWLVISPVVKNQRLSIKNPQSGL